MNYKYSRLLAMLVISVLVAFPTFAQTSTTGAMEGQVMEASGPLPGVTVEITSPAMAGTRTAVTDANGRFRFSLLPPGTYSMVASLSGFQTVRQSNVLVGLGRTASLDIRMSAAAIAEEITVTAEAPVVDVTSTTTGANITSEQMEKIPIQRDFYSVAQVAPGTFTDASGTTFQGSTGLENQYIIDGLNTTGVELGSEAKVLNFDYIQEVEVLTGGLPAEYGRVTGGVINAITKSGGNEFSGDAFGYFASEEDNDTAEERPLDTTTVASTPEEWDFGLDVGGYIMRDRLWFFGAYNRVSETRESLIFRPVDAFDRPIPGMPAAGTEVPTEITRDIYAGKLTFNINPNHTLTASMFGDPSDTEGAIFAIAGPPSTYDATRKTGGTDFVGRYSGIFGQRFLINALIGHHEEEDIIGGPGRDIPLLLDQSILNSPTARLGGYGFLEDQEFEREVYKLDFTSFLGNHEVKFGGDMEDLAAFDARTYSGGGDLVYKLRNRGADRQLGTADDIIYYRHRFFTDPEAFVSGDPSSWQIQDPLIVTPETQNTSAYIQDNWRIRPNLTLNLGVRWEMQEVIGRTGDTNLKIDDNWAPRIGLIWDVLNNGRSKLYANYGRFYESIPMDINIRSFGGEIIVFSYNFDPTPGNFTPVPTPSRNAALGGHQTPVDPDLEGQHVNEYLLGYEYEVSPGLAVGIKGTFRELGQVIEDFLVTAGGEYFIANPGRGIGSRSFFYDIYTTEDPTISSAPAPKAEREYTAAELSARKRFSNNWQFFGSYVWSELEGNYDGLFQVSTGQQDPNINSAFDYADFLINFDGKLSNDRTHQVKLHGSYVFPTGAMLDGLTIGAAAHYASGRPLTAMGYSFLYGNFEYYLTPRGSLGRGPADYEMDLHFGYPVRFGNGMEMNLLLDVFNALDLQRATLLDERYNLQPHGICGGIPDELCNGDNGLQHQPGSTQPVGQLANPRATAPNPDFLSAGRAFTAPRQYRFGVKLTF